MTVKREIRELERDMKETIKLFELVYYGSESEPEAMKELEKKVKDLKHDLDTVLINLKALGGR